MLSEVHLNLFDHMMDCRCQAGTVVIWRLLFDYYCGLENCSNAFERGLLVQIQHI